MTLGSQRDGEADLIGCIAIGRNEGKRLVRCLKSLQGVVGAIVYVDSGSTDGSVAAARELGAEVVELDLTVPFTAARARNEGYAALNAKMPHVAFVQFVDGDCELAPGWIGEALAALAQAPQVAAVCGRRRERFPDASIYNRLADLEWDTPIGETAACGGDSLMRAVAFEAVGGFQARLMAGEEPELCARLRTASWTIQRIDAEMTLHDAATTRFGQWWMRAVRSGFGRAQVWSVTRGEPNRLYGPELQRTLIWGAVVPVLIVIAAFVYPLAALAIAAVYPLRMVRIALRRGIGDRANWAYAWLMIISAFAELQGAARYFLRGGARQPRKLIEYK
ncbi:MAG TPA: glycosyltransferase [Rhizomicrobium sp.]